MDKEKLKTHDEFMGGLAEPNFSQTPIKPLPVPIEISKKKRRFRNWFFKGRIEKKEAKVGRIDDLSKEYDEGKVLKHG